MSLNRKTYALNTGNHIPAVGYGTCRYSINYIVDLPKDQVTDLVQYAVDEVGYRHIDTAFYYQNEEQIGEALKRVKVDRSELFVTSKLWCTHHRPEYVSKMFKHSLDSLKLDYLDLYLMHWPTALKPSNDLLPKNDATNDYEYDEYSFIDTWKEMERLLETGKVKQIGVSNFTAKNLELLLKNCKVVPAVNQVELNPYLVQEKLLEYCQSKDIHVTAYSSLGSGYKKVDIMKDELIIDLAKKYGTDPSIICLSWGAKRTSIIPKSANKQRIKSNFTHLIDLSDQDMKAISSLNRNFRSINLFKGVFDD